MKVSFILSRWRSDLLTVSNSRTRSSSRDDQFLLVAKLSGGERARFEHLAAPFQVFFDLFEQAFDVDRLGQVAADTRRQRQFALVVHDLRRQRDDRRGAEARVAAQGGRDLAPGHIRQVDVGQDQVGDFAARDVDAVQAILGDQDAVAPISKGALDQRAARGVIFDVEDRFLHGACAFKSGFSSSTYLTPAACRSRDEGRP